MSWRRQHVVGGPEELVYLLTLFTAKNNDIIVGGSSSIRAAYYPPSLLYTGYIPAHVCGVCDGKSKYVLFNAILLCANDYGHSKSMYASGFSIREHTANQFKALWSSAIILFPGLDFYFLKTLTIRSSQGPKIERTISSTAQQCRRIGATDCELLPPRLLEFGPMQRGSDTRSIFLGCFFLRW